MLLVKKEEALFVKVFTIHAQVSYSHILPVIELK